MKIVNISKAQFFNVGIESVTIVIDREVANYKSLQDAAKHYQEEATKIVDVLKKALPGGTFDRVAAVLLERAASHLKISYYQEA